MKIQAELSVSPFSSSFEFIIQQVIDDLSKLPEIQCEVQPMSTRIIGDYKQVMEALEKVIYPLFTRHKSLVHITLSNACPEDCEIK